jgi:hypothetical protein
VFFHLVGVALHASAAGASASCLSRDRHYAGGAHCPRPRPMTGSWQQPR